MAFPGYPHLYSCVLSTLPLDVTGGLCSAIVAPPGYLLFYFSLRYSFVLSF